MHAFFQYMFHCSSILIEFSQIAPAQKKHVTYAVFQFDIDHSLSLPAQKEIALENVWYAALCKQG